MASTMRKLLVFGLFIIEATLSINVLGSSGTDGNDSNATYSSGMSDDNITGSDGATKSDNNSYGNSIVQYSGRDVTGHTNHHDNTTNGTFNHLDNNEIPDRGVFSETVHLDNGNVAISSRKGMRLSEKGLESPKNNSSELQSRIKSGTKKKTVNILKNSNTSSRAHHGNQLIEDKSKEVESKPQFLEKRGSIQLGKLSSETPEEVEEFTEMNTFKEIPINEDSEGSGDADDAIFTNFNSKPTLAVLLTSPKSPIYITTRRITPSTAKEFRETEKLIPEKPKEKFVTLVTKLPPSIEKQVKEESTEEGQNNENNTGKKKIKKPDKPYEESGSQPKIITDLQNGHKTLSPLLPSTTKAIPDRLEGVSKSGKQDNKEATKKVYKIENQDTSDTGKPDLDKNKKNHDGTNIDRGTKSVIEKPTTGVVVLRPADTVPSTETPPDGYLIGKFKMTRADFCSYDSNFQKAVAKSIDLRLIIKPSQVHIINNCDSTGIIKKRSRRSLIDVMFYIADENGEFSLEKTTLASTLLSEDKFEEDPYFKDRFVAVKQINGRQQAIDAPIKKHLLDMGPGIVVAIVIACIAGLSLFILAALQIVTARRRHTFSKITRTPTVDNFQDAGYSSSRVSIDSIALSSLAQRMSLGYANPALNVAEQEDLSNPTKFIGLPYFRLDMERLEDEFGKLYCKMPRMSEVPNGAENKNRYANIHPISETQVLLRPIYGDRSSEYINANFVKGYKRRPKFFIATQAPLNNTISDFWRMVWEQQCRVIVMLTALQENAMSKCTEYWPNTNGVDVVRLYGAFQVTQLSRDVYQEYIVSTLQIKDLESNLHREVIHFCYTDWPNQGVPESSLSIVKFILQLRPHIKKYSNPTVVHCSPGTGRTGTLIAIDICMRSFDETSVADILNCVHRLRQERAGAVQTIEQYAFIFKAINDYALMLANPSISSSATSSSVSINT